MYIVQNRVLNARNYLLYIQTTSEREKDARERGILMSFASTKTSSRPLCSTLMCPFLLFYDRTLSLILRSDSTSRRHLRKIALCSKSHVKRRACRLVMYAAHGGPGLTYKNGNESRLVTIALLPFLPRRFLEQIIIRADVRQTSVYLLTWHACLARCMRSVAFCSCSSAHHPKTYRKLLEKRKRKEIDEI